MSVPEALQRFLVLVLCGLAPIAAGCGDCMMYRVRTTARGTAFPTDAPDERVQIRMQSDGSNFDARALDATPVPGHAAALCLSVTPPYGDSDIRLVLDFGQELGALQTGGAIGGFACTNGVAMATPPDLRTAVWGALDIAGVEVVLDGIQATSTSLVPSRFDVVLTGRTAEGREYKLVFDLALERVGNAVFCG